MRVDPDAGSPLDFQRRFISELIAVRARELAGQAALELIRRHPEIARRYHPLPSETWTSNFLGPLADLAAAALAASPEVFADQVAWVRTSLAVRGVPEADLRAGLVVLRDIVLRELPPEDVPPVAQCLDAALAAFHRPEPGSDPLTADTPHGRAASAYLLKVLEGDRLAASQVIHAALRDGMSVHSVYLDVLVPAQREVGRMWHLGEISIAEEHFATSTTLTIMSRILPLADRRPPDGRAVLAACIDGNIHDLGVRIVADFFELAGWRAIHLGASVPDQELVIAVRDFQVDLVALSIALSSQLPGLSAAIELLRHELGERCPKILVGGSGLVAAGPAERAAQLAFELGADGFARSADAALILADELVPPRTPAA